MAKDGDFDYAIKTYSDAITFDFLQNVALDFRPYVNVPNTRKYGAGLTISGFGIQPFKKNENLNNQ